MNQINQKILKLIDGLAIGARNKANRVYDIYENYFGIKELKDIQLSVLNAEKLFIDTSKARREAQTSIHRLQSDLNRLRQKLEHMNRADENYLKLLTEEHILIKDEVDLMEKLRKSEEEEREKFTYFSNRLRESQDFEKVRQERLKYISLSVSLIGALLGVIATSINYSFRQKNFDSLIRSLEEQTDQVKEIRFHSDKLGKILHKLEKKLDQTLNNSKITKDKAISDLNHHPSSIDTPSIKSQPQQAKLTDNYKLNLLLKGLAIAGIIVLIRSFNS